MKTLYLLLCIAGTALPVSRFLPFLRDHGLDVKLMVEQLFANPTAAFFGTDVIVSSIVLWVFVISERRGVRHWWLALVANVVVGVSLALPLFLYLRVAPASGRPVRRRPGGE